MDVLEVSPGLWRWTGFHPEWKEEVGCVYYEAPDAIVLIDPLVPPESPERFWAALDRDVERLARPVRILVTVYWHARSAREIAARYRARIWAPVRGRRPIERRAGPVSDAFRVGDPLPGGVEAFPTARGSETVLWIPEHRALVFGDVLLGAEGGGLRLCPASWLSGRVGLEGLAASLRPLLELPVERVLVSHGEPVLAGGREALEHAIAHPEGGQEAPSAAYTSS